VHSRIIAGIFVLVINIVIRAVIFCHFIFQQHLHTLTTPALLLLL
jgi:hypothetical protein